MTSVLGHTVEWDFAPDYRTWNSVQPGQLFDAPVVQKVSQPEVADNIKSEARGASALYIWTDCDREGEYIGQEVRDIALKVNPRLEVKRAKFSNIERAHVLGAAQRPGPLDERQAMAVAARIELDLRIGAAFTRLQTLQLQSLRSLKDQIISYGTFPFLLGVLVC
jgi:DNA topoisomerase-3